MRLQAFLSYPQKHTGKISWTLTMCVFSKDNEQGREEMSPVGGFKGAGQSWSSGMFGFTHIILKTFLPSLPTFKSGWFPTKIHASNLTWKSDILTMLGTCFHRVAVGWAGEMVAPFRWSHSSVSPPHNSSLRAKPSPLPPSIMSTWHSAWHLGDPQWKQELKK